jgi:Contractile injection system tube protein
MSVAKATICNLETNGVFQVQFNPQEGYSVSSSNAFKTEAGRYGPPTVEFTGTVGRKLTLQLHFDTTHLGIDVRISIWPILALLEKDSRTGMPPRLLFTWGSFQFCCVLESAGQDYTRFLPAGIPVRADVSLTLAEIAYSVPRSQAVLALAATVPVPVLQGENMSQLATRLVGDPHNWRALATANNIDNPRKLAVKLSLKLPSF